MKNLPKYACKRVIYQKNYDESFNFIRRLAMEKVVVTECALLASRGNGESLQEK